MKSDSQIIKSDGDDVRAAQQHRPTGETPAGLALRARNEIFERFAEVRARFINRGRVVSSEMVGGANDSREGGLLLREALGKEHLAKEDLSAWYREHQKFLPRGMSLEELNWFLRQAERAPVTEFGEIARSQLELFVGMGLIEAPHRLERQSASPPAQESQYVTLISTAKLRIQEFVKERPVRDWSPSLREKMRAELEPLATLYRELENG